MAIEAERLGIKSSMTPEEGERVIWDRHRDWYMSPALAERIPSVTLEEYGKLGSAVDELDRHIARLRMSPDQLRIFIEQLRMSPDQLRIFLERIGDAERRVPHPAVEFGPPELPYLSGEESGEMMKRVSKATDRLQGRPEKALDTLTRPTTTPKGTSGTQARRRGRRRSESTPLENAVWSAYLNHKGDWGVFGEVADILKPKFPAVNAKSVGRIVRKMKARRSRSE
jgi:hypothetical protein